MGRRRRPHLPGTIFHLVTRTQRHEPLFVRPLRTPIVGLIHSAVQRTDAKLIAYAVMPNHLHIALLQGEDRLTATMQPLLRRLALLVQRHHGIEGRILERAYRDRACRDAEHARTVVAYVHLNPWRAGLCDDALEYPWSSQPAYVAGADPSGLGIDPELRRRVLALYATGAGRSESELCDDYRVWVHRWMQNIVARRSKGNEDPAQGAPQGPDVVIGEGRRACTVAGDAAWRRSFGVPLRPGRDDPRPHLDLRDFLLGQLGRLEPGLTLEQLRGSWLPRRPGRARMRLVAAAAERGYRTVDIAAFFNVSPQTVSRVKAAAPHRECR